MTAEQEFQAELLERLSAAGGWLIRAIVKYRPYLQNMPADGNKALFQANMDLEKAIKMFTLKVLGK